jgi:hypothetical protein
VKFGCARYPEEKGYSIILTVFNFLPAYIVSSNHHTGYTCFDLLRPSILVTLLFLIQRFIRKLKFFLIFMLIDFLHGIEVKRLEIVLFFYSLEEKEKYGIKDKSSKGAYMMCQLA